MGLLAGETLDPDLINELWTRQVLSTGDTTGYGIGFFIGTDPDGRRTVGHGGGSIGGNAHLYIYPDEGIVIGSAANAEAPIHDNALWAIALPFVDESFDGSSRPGVLSGVTLDCTRSIQEQNKEVILSFLPDSSSVVGWAAGPEEHAHRLLETWIEGNQIRLISLSESGAIGSIRLDRSSSGYSGAWNRDTLSCRIDDGD
jgi:hypothetical protein